ncbi:hypothetical protein NG799_28590 [Laspinema sp. D1]|uniref:Uncharacterized protein n=1 Tax=Laspinema palackyanum D2a TaxID=2953684 RepID=A0ABT2MZV4_9CYAN|nr:hypothetical protein [Laspinema sp. D2a]
MNQIKDLGERSPEAAAWTRRSALKGLTAILPSLLSGRVASRWNAPAPKFNFGDQVSYSFPGDDDEIVTYEGKIMGMVYCPDDLELDCQFGKGWFYAVHWTVMPGCHLPHLFKQIDTSCLESESELRGIA